MCIIEYETARFECPPGIKIIVTGRILTDGKRRLANHNFNISYELSEGETVYLYVYGALHSTTGYYTIFVED